MSAAAIDITSVLQRLGIEARRRGREWTAICPNREHDDRKPSWRMRDEPGTVRHSKHHCFSCSFGGSDMTTLFVTSVEGHFFKAQTDRVGWAMYP